ncbi:MAG: hypothetical protein ABI972_02345, partial [Acidobacteriota bacterium]
LPKGFVNLDERVSRTAVIGARGEVLIRICAVVAMLAMLMIGYSVYRDFVRTYEAVDEND